MSIHTNREDVLYQQTIMEYHSCMIMCVSSGT